MKDRKKSDIENTEKIPVIHPEEIPEEKDPSGTVLRVFAKIGLFLAIVIVVTLLSRFIYIKINGETLSLIDDSKPVFTGHNGNGYADVMFHPEDNALNTLKTKRDRMKRLHQDTSDIDDFIDSIGCKLDYDDHLSNGMNVTYTCDYDENAAKKAGYHVIDDVKSYTVMGLSDYTPIDPYKDLQTQWDTDSDTPVLKITPSPAYKDLFTYSYTYDGKNEAVIHAHPDERKLHENGYEVKKSKESEKVKVSTQPQKIIHPETLSEAETEQAKKQAVQSYEKQRNECDTHTDDTLTLLSSDTKLISWTYDQNGRCIAVLQVTNTYLNNQVPATYSFTVRCTGTLWRKEDGTLSFSPEDDHTCAFLRQGNRSVTEK